MSTRNLLAFILLMSSAAFAQSVKKPQWTLPVPAPTLVTGNYSELVYAGSDSLGNTLLMLRYADLTALASISFAPKGYQFFLIRQNGTLIASGEAPNSMITPVLVSAKRFLAIIDRTTLTEFKVNGAGFIATPISFPGMNEAPFDSAFPLETAGYSYGPSGYTQLPGQAFFNPGLNRLIDKGRLYTFERPIFGRVNTVRCYLVGKLKP
jgi:hypothetical protein